MVKQVQMDKISRLRNFKMFKQVHKDKISRLRNVQMFKQIHKDKFLGYVSLNVQTSSWG